MLHACAFHVLHLSYKVRVPWTAPWANHHLSCFYLQWYSVTNVCVHH